MYTAKIKCYAPDVYDWDADDKYERLLNNLHTAGVARSFLDYGVYETEIEWVDGARYPIPTGDGPLNLDDVAFRGISDPSFKPLKIAGEAFYLIV